MPRPRQGAADLNLLRGFELSVAGRPVALPLSSQRLIAFLAIQQRPTNRLFVAGALWLDVREDRSLGNLRSALWRLREVGAAVVEVVHSDLRLRADVNVDFWTGVRTARQILEPSPGRMPSQAETDILADDLLPDWYDDWLILERERFRQLRMRALEAIASHHLAANRFAEAVSAGQAAIAAEPLRESAHRIVVEAHLAEGNPGEAIRHFEIFRRLLERELGLEPSPAISELIDRFIRDARVTRR